MHNLPFFEWNLDLRKILTFKFIYIIHLLWTLLLSTRIFPQSNMIQIKKEEIGVLKLRFAFIKKLPIALKFYIIQFKSRIFQKLKIKWVLMILWWCTYIIANVNREVLVQNWLFERGMNNENTNSLFKAQSVEREKLHHTMGSMPFWSYICI